MKLLHQRTLTLTTIDPVVVPIGLINVNEWVNKLPDPLLPTKFIDTERSTLNVPKPSKTDLTELQASIITVRRLHDHW